MRLGVLDVGSNTVHLLVVDAYQGARPVPAYSLKKEFRFGEHLEDGNRLSQECAQQLRAFVDEALEVAEDKGVQQLMAFATSAVRDAVNGDELLAWIKAETKVDISVLPGQDESRLTFLAARRWFGWSSGRLIMLDIGGGSLEIASGVDEEPGVAVSLPLGAGRLTREWLPGDPPSADEARRLRKHVRAEIAATAGTVMRDGRPDHAVATSKTFRQLARIAGAAPSSVSCGTPMSPSWPSGWRGPASRTGPSCPGCPAAGPTSSPRARSWPTPQWTFSGCGSWKSARGPCARA
jgi:exopolyphosphatase/guanosine-5'-triphosphate,3'-diphosphate pyrophosphatase